MLITLQCIGPYFLALALDGVEVSASRPGRFSPGVRAPVLIELEVW
jgi:hypothetical protein